MEQSNTIELFFWGMSLLQHVSCQVLNHIQVIDTNRWLCEMVLRPVQAEVKIWCSAFAWAGIPLSNEAQSNEHSLTLIVFQCQ